MKKKLIFEIETDNYPTWDSTGYTPWDGTGYIVLSLDEAKELIQCKDCKFYEPENHQCKMVIGTWFPEEYCNSSERKEEMGDTCTDGRFEMIEKAKRELIEATNITQSPKEMEVLDSILFRLYQMGWLQKIDAAKDPVDAIPVEFIEERMNDYAEDKFYAASMILDMLVSAWKREKDK